jgi:hypothetical protein
MREVDPRTQFSRRFILKASAAAAPAVAVSSALGLSIEDAWAEGGALDPATMKTLVQVARDIYPHDFLGDVYYITAVKPWNDKAAAKPAVKAMLVGGVQRLDADARDRHKVAYIDVGWEEDRVALLRGIEQTEFFKALRSDLVVSLYNQHDLWPKFGYEGASAEKGGYLHRGFDDISWLPKG